MQEKITKNDCEKRREKDTTDIRKWNWQATLLELVLKPAQAL